jgi:hypothetical protein
MVEEIKLKQATEFARIGELELFSEKFGADELLNLLKGCLGNKDVKEYLDLIKRNKNKNGNFYG